MASLKNENPTWNYFSVKTHLKRGKKYCFKIFRNKIQTVKNHNTYRRYFSKWLKQWDNRHFILYFVYDSVPTSGPFPYKQPWWLITLFCSEGSVFLGSWMKSANEMQNTPLLENLTNYRICHAKGCYLGWRLVKTCSGQTSDTYMPASKL